MDFTFSMEISRRTGEDYDGVFWSILYLIGPLRIFTEFDGAVWIFFSFTIGVKKSNNSCFKGAMIAL